MNNFKKEILNDLMELVDKIVDHEIQEALQEGQKVIPDEVLVHISYAMEHLAGIAGFTNEVIKENKPDYLKDKDN